MRTGTCRPIAWGYGLAAGFWLVAWVAEAGAQGALVWRVCHGGPLLGIGHLTVWIILGPSVAMVLLLTAAARKPHALWVPLLAGALYGGFALAALALYVQS